MNGVLIIDKPAGLTSHDVVNRVRRILQQRSIGHLGTLDPMATGVLPLITGTLTRLAQFYTRSEKVYEGTIRFGFATDTYDAEGEATTAPQPVSLSAEQVEILAARFRGVIEQTPPPFSAKKIHGVPAYKLARKQKEVVLKPVQVEIKEFEILAVEVDRVRFRARVASGTYMRSRGSRNGKGTGLWRPPGIAAPNLRSRIQSRRRPHSSTSRRCRTTLLIREQRQSQRDVRIGDPRQSQTDSRIREPRESRRDS